MHSFRRVAALAALALVPLAGPVSQVSAHADTAVGGSFSTLNYNVAGLPVVHEPPTTLSMEDAATAIGQRIGSGGYDLVNMQEDFNYHAYIYAGDTTHAYRTATSGAAGIGDGLNTVSNYAWDGDDFERDKWSSCYPDNGDCITPKGFSFMRWRVAEGDYIDVYNIHTNAGTSSGDETARENEWTQLSSFISTHSAGNAVIVMGDTNSRYTRTADQLQNFVATNGLTDAWVQLEMGGTAPAAGASPLMCDEAAITNTCEITNKTLYRSSALINLTPTYYNNDHAGFLDGNGAMLSDMDPIQVNFNWSQSSNYKLTDQFGGPHGDYYNDINSVPAGEKATTLTLRSGSRVDNVALTLANGATLAHGGTGGTASSLTLGSGEYVTSAYLCEAEYSGHTRIFYAKFTTNLGNTLAGGSTTSDCTTLSAPSGWQLAGFDGRSGDEVDKLGLIFTKV